MWSGYGLMPCEKAIFDFNFKINSLMDALFEMYFTCSLIFQHIKLKFIVGQIQIGRAV
jgi:hypothetical protein